jgi:NAD(P)-dependent dehydrogenase (short-subunit alcohol dehydrogenase family)
VKDFEGLVAAVTGGASGIGAATAAQLADRGASVVVLDRSAPGGPALTANLRHLRCDIARDDDLRAAMASIGDDLARLDVLVNNAGIGAAGDVTANDRDEWHHVLDVNVVSAARVCAAALPLLRRSPSAAIVNVSSVVASVGVRNRALYAASKGAVVAMTFAMAADLVAEGIRVNAVAPGTADTPWVARLLDAAADPAAEAAALRARQPMGRLVTADEVAWAICYLASPHAASTTGTVLGVDGGMATLRV